MCKQWPCCNVGDYNIRRYDRSGNILWDYHWWGDPNGGGPAGACDGPSNTTIAVGSKGANTWASSGSDPWNFIPPSISQTDGSYSLTSDTICFDEDGEVLWQVNLASQLETITVFLGAGSTYGIDLFGAAFQCIMSSANEIVVAVAFNGRLGLPYSQATTYWIRYANLDPATGAVNSFSGRAYYSGPGATNLDGSTPVLKPKAWIGGGAALSGDTMVLPSRSAYDSPGNLAFQAAGQGTIAGIAEDNLFHYATGYVSGTTSPDGSYSLRQIAPLSPTYGAEYASSQPPHTPNSIYTHVTPMGYLHDDYPAGGGNMMVAMGKLSVTRGGTSPNNYFSAYYPSIGKISYDLTTITAPFIFRADGSLFPTANPIVDLNIAYGGEFVCDTGSYTGNAAPTSVTFARFSPAGAWMWGHGSYCKPHTICANSDLICCGFARRKDDRQFNLSPQ